VRHRASGFPKRLKIYRTLNREFRKWNPEPILTPQDVADRLRFDSARTVYELTRRRNKRPLPALRAGKVLRFYWSDVEKWLRGEDVA
jgi:hypothetical protein